MVTSQLVYYEKTTLPYSLSQEQLTDVNGDFEFTAVFGSGNDSSDNTINAQIINGNDDTEESITNGKVEQGEKPGNLGENAGNAQWVGLRFPNIDIPKGALIESAYLEFSAAATNSGTCNLNFYAEASDNSPSLTNNNYDLSARPRSTAVLHWANVPA